MLHERLTFSENTIDFEYICFKRVFLRGYVDHMLVMALLAFAFVTF